MQTKICNGCKEEKTITSYYVDSRTGTPAATCKACVCIKQKAYRDSDPEKQRLKGESWRKKNPEKYLEIHKSWREKNKERLNEKARIRARENPGKLKEANKKWRDKNKENMLERNREWRLKNPDKAKAWRKKNYLANKDNIRSVRVAWDEANKDRIRARSAKWWAENKERTKPQRQAWYNANPELIRLNAANRRARIKGNGGRLSKGITLKLIELQEGKCNYCKDDISNVHHIDHIMPISLGGANTDDNVQLLCPTCNMRKSNKHPEVFMKELGLI